MRSRLAVDAGPALGREQRDDVVAGPHARHPLADRLDDAGALVAEHRRRVAGRVGSAARVHVRVADAAGREPDEHLAGARVGELHVLHHERLAELLEDSSPNPHRPDATTGGGGDLALGQP